MAAVIAPAGAAPLTPDPPHLRRVTRNCDGHPIVTSAGPRTDRRGLVDSATPTNPVVESTDHQTLSGARRRRGQPLPTTDEIPPQAPAIAAAERFSLKGRHLKHREARHVRRIKVGSVQTKPGPSAPAAVTSTTGCAAGSRRGGSARPPAVRIGEHVGDPGHVRMVGAATSPRLLRVPRAVHRPRWRDGRRRHGCGRLRATAGRRSALRARRGPRRSGPGPGGTASAGSAAAAGTPTRPMPPIRPPTAVVDAQSRRS